MDRVGWGLHYFFSLFFSHKIPPHLRSHFPVFQAVNWKTLPFRNDNGQCIPENAGESFPFCYFLIKFLF
jgi:hypothetical protein